jgi:hypothetical protein
MIDKYANLKRLFEEHSNFVEKQLKHLIPNSPLYLQSENVFWFDIKGNMHFSKDIQNGIANLVRGLQNYHALYYEFIDKDLIKVKQAFYQYGKICEFSLKKYDEELLTYDGLRTFSNILLSDNIVLIKSFADFSPIRFAGKQFDEGVEKGHYSHIRILQCIIKEDWEECYRLIPIMKAKNKRMKLDVDFYEALISKDADRVESILKKFVTKRTHKYRNQYLFEDFISYPAIGYSKLAWYMGMEVEIDSTLIPKDWLPIKPLKNEEYIIDYDFVKSYLG